MSIKGALNKKALIHPAPGLFRGRFCAISEECNGKLYSCCTPIFMGSAVGGECHAVQVYAEKKRKFEV